MSVPHGCNDNKDVVESFKEALRQRVGADRYQMWFTHGVEFIIDQPSVHSADEGDAVARETPSAQTSSSQTSKIIVCVHGQFALDRIQKNLLRELRGAAMQACGHASIDFQLDQPIATQASLPLPGLTTVNPSETKMSGPRGRTNKKSTGKQRTSRQRSTSRGKPRSLSSLVTAGASQGISASQGKRGSQRNNAGQGKGAKPMPSAPQQLDLPNLTTPDDVAHQQSHTNQNIAALVAGSDALNSDSCSTPVNEKTYATFVVGSSNRLAHTAMSMACQDPASASPLFLFGPTGTGKSHALAAIADQFRRRHRMRRVVLMSAEQFTNDFITSVGNLGIAAFRRRYREVDALLIDGMQFLGAKTATLREMLYTVESIISSGRPLIASGISAPSEIPGLTDELAGRLASGLLCSIGPLDQQTRETLLRRELSRRCQLDMPESTIEHLVANLAGDGRVIQGVANLTNTLQRMLGRVPSLDELRRFGGDLLRGSQPVATLSVIESAVCQAFQLPEDTLRGGSQTRAVTEPRMLAMYLSRQLTSSAYTEIARHFGGRSHSTAIGAEKNVKKWLENQRTIGRGAIAMSAQEAIDRVESLLRTG